jgi:hypothetical protein
VADADAPLVETDEYVTLDSDSLAEMDITAPDIQLLFPRSVACFKARGGNMRYFHGGISLQELVVPCLTVTTGAIEDAATISYEVSIPDPVTNSIVSVDIEAKSEEVFLERTPTLEVRASIDGKAVADPVEVEIDRGTNTARVRLKQGAISGASTVRFTTANTDTRETIDERTVGLDLLFGDDDMGFDV